MSLAMLTLSTFTSRPRRYRRTSSEEIRVYRKHAARAIAEERWDIAKIFLDRILEVNPRHTEAWLMRGHLHRHCLNDPEEALHCYRKVIVLGGYDTANPHVARAQQSLDQLLRRLA